MIDFAHARKTMVDNQVATSSITDRPLLAAMRRIPRERFVPAALRDLAYIDREVPVAPGRVLAAPAPFARLAQLAAITPTDKVLDAGSGTGYSTAVLASLAARAVGLEIDSALAKLARENLAGEGIANVAIVTGQVQAAGEAPFDVVVVEDLVEAPPSAMLTLLREGGRLVAWIGKGGVPPVARIFFNQGGVLAGRAAFDAQQPARRPAAGDQAFIF